MAGYFARIELHDAKSWLDYHALHNAMEFQGFSRTILGTDGIRYHLPTAEYFIESDLTIQEIHNKAASAARMVVKKFAVVVIAEENAFFSGLQPVVTQPLPRWLQSALQTPLKKPAPIPQWLQSVIQPPPKKPAPIRR